MNLYIVRHGETNENIGKIMQGNMDTLLNERGKQQAHEASLLLKDIDFKQVYSSPKSRTKETAMILNKGNIIYDNRLLSRNHGEFEGLRRDEINIKDYWNYNSNTKYLKAESVKDIYNRIDSFLKELKTKYSDNDNILIVTHSGICRVLYYYFNGIPEDGDMYHTYQAVNGKIEKYKL